MSTWMPSTPPWNSCATPQFKGLPVVIGGRRRLVNASDGTQHDFSRLHDYVGRDVVTTATYEARAFGVHSGMGLMKAAKLAPDALFLPADFDRYRDYSQRFKSAVAAIAPRMEDRGIDEIYLDLTDVPGETAELAQRIKTAVTQATGLSCSIGVTPNKLLSKLASELQKPDGLTVLDHSDIPTRIWPLPAKAINGIGPKATAKLEALGIWTIGELVAANRQRLIETFGERYAGWLIDAAHGRDDRPVVSVREPKSISRETTFERDLDPVRDRQALSVILLDLCHRLSGDLVRKGYVGKTIGVKLRFADFRIVTQDQTLDQPTADPVLIRSAARNCLKRFVLDRRLRLLGLRAASLVRDAENGERSTHRDGRSG